MYVSNYPFPNRTCDFHRIRLSRQVFCASLNYFCRFRDTIKQCTTPCTPSPCIRYYPDRLSTIGTPSP